MAPGEERNRRCSFHSHPILTMSILTDLLSQLTSSGYTGDILFKPSNGLEDDDWTMATRSWGCQGKKDPKVALKPKTLEDVSKAVLWLGRNHLDFAVRSGGTAQSQCDGIILDMGHFKRSVYYHSPSFYISYHAEWTTTREHRQ